MKHRIYSKAIFAACLLTAGVHAQDNNTRDQVSSINQHYQQELQQIDGTYKRDKDELDRWKERELDKIRQQKGDVFSKNPKIRAVNAEYGDRLAALQAERSQKRKDASTQMNANKRVALAGNTVPPAALKSTAAADSATNKAELQSSMWRDNTRALTAINDEYGEAQAEQSAEYSRRLIALTDQINADHKQLSAQKLELKERTKATAELRARHKAEREALAAWNTEQHRQLRERHKQQRAQQWESHNARIKQMQAGRTPGTPLPVGSGASAEHDSGSNANTSRGSGEASQAGREFDSPPTSAYNKPSGGNPAKTPSDATTQVKTPVAPPTKDDRSGEVFGPGGTVTRGDPASAEPKPGADGGSAGDIFAGPGYASAGDPASAAPKPGGAGDVFAGPGYASPGDPASAAPKPGSKPTKPGSVVAPAAASEAAPTGSSGSAAGAGVDQPEFDSDSGTYSWDDGTTVRGIGPDGEVGQVNDKGDIVFNDGTTIVHTGDQQTTVHRPDGSSRTYDANESGQWNPAGAGSAGTAPPTGSGTAAGTGIDQPKLDSETGSYAWGDGTTVSGIGPEGDVGKVNDKGDIVFGDGTTIVHTGDGQVVIHNPDGSSDSYTADDQGRWHPDSGSGSSGSGGSSESSSGGDSGSDSSSDSSDSSDDDGGSDDSSDSGDSAEDADAEAESSDAESGGDGDAETNTDGGESYGEPDTGHSTGPSSVVQGVLDRRTGTEPETGVPENCDDTGGSIVTQPGPGGSGNCIPGGLPGISTEEDEDTSTPDAGESADAEDARRAGGTDLGGRITQPGIAEQGIPVEDLPSHTPLDQSPVTNPAPEGGR